MVEVEPFRFPFRWTRRRALLALFLLLGVCLLLSPFVGSVPIPPADVVGILLQKLSGGLWHGNPCPLPVHVGGQPASCGDIEQGLWKARVPEVILAALVGASLGISGGTLQGVFRNPLADPYLLGISSGAAVGASTVLMFGVGLQQEQVFLPLMAFVGAVATALLVLAASHLKRASVEVLLLTGVALSSLFGSLISLLFVLRSQTLLQVTFWLLGSLTGATWDQAGLVLGSTLIGGTLLALQGRDLNLLQVGDESARGLGSEVEVVRRRLLLLTSVVTAVAVAFSGIIGFVGLVSPHVVRRLYGPDYRALLPLSAVFGATFLLISDDLADTILGGGFLLPVGVVTAFIGAPFFLWVLYRRRSGRLG